MARTQCIRPDCKAPVFKSNRCEVHFADYKRRRANSAEHNAQPKCPKCRKVLKHVDGCLGCAEEPDYMDDAEEAARELREIAKTLREHSLNHDAADAIEAAVKKREAA